uniref:Uncharacterized protein n=1 Tax=Panagrolaimus superbus TaxID=310955 RepID=A0A914YKV1_9BILA
MPSIGQGTTNKSLIGDGASPNNNNNNGIGHGTIGLTRLTNLNIQQQIKNQTVDIFNPFHPGPVKTGTWPAPIPPPPSTATTDFINGYGK